MSTMSGHPSSAAQQGQRPTKGGGGQTSTGGGGVKVYLHAVTEEQAELLTDTATTRPLQEVKKMSGADVEFDPNPSPVPGMKILNIRGVLSQIQAAVSLISQKTGSKDPLSDQAQTFWLQWVEAAFPDLDSRAYFLPPVYVNRVPMTRQSTAGQDVLVLESAPGQAGQSIQIGQTGQSGQIGQSKQTNWSVQTVQSGHATQTGQSAQTDRSVQTSQSIQTGQTGQSGQSKQTFQSGKSPLIERSFQTGQLIQTAQSAMSGQTSQSGQSNQSAMIPSTAASIPQPPRVQDSDLRDDAAMQRVLLCLQKLCEDNKEVLVGLTQLQFGQYLGEPCYTAAAAQLPLPANLPPALPRNWRRGDFDVLLIHRHFGLVTCEVKAFGDNTQALNMSKDDKDKNIRKKLKDAMSQLDKAEAMLSHLVSDIAPGLPVTKVIAFPNLTADEVQQAISCNTQLTQKEGFSLKDLCRCLGTRDPADIVGLCLCSDQLSDPKTPCDVSSHVLRELGHWWQRRVAGPDIHMTPKVYKELVARFCGPATTVTVPCTCPPRVSVKTLGQAVWCTGECYTAVITLFPEQVHLLNTAPPTLFVTGPPGTGKTLVLLMMGIKWLRCGHPVYIVSNCDESRAACIMLYHLLLQTVKTQQSAGVSHGQPHLLLYELEDGKDVEKAVNDLSQAASGGSLYVIADEVDSFRKSRYLKTLCDKLLTQVPRLHLWAASCYHGHAPAGWQEEYLTRPLRSPPAVVREIEQNKFITDWGEVQPYSERGVPDHTDGPPVRRVYHRGQGHSDYRPVDCATCGREVASFLHSLRVGVTENVTTTATTVTSSGSATAPTCLQWRDVLVLNWDYVSDDSGMLKALKEAGIPVRVMKEYDDIEDVATARSDVLWVTGGRHVRGLEKKVVVCVDDNHDVDGRLHSMSRCTSQLVIVD